MVDKNFGEPPKQDVAGAVGDMVRLWQVLARNSADLSAAKRTLFMAYVAEGFTEAQALELIKSV